MTWQDVKDRMHEALRAGDFVMARLLHTRLCWLEAESAPPARRERA